MRHLRRDDGVQLTATLCPAAHARPDSTTVLAGLVPAIHALVAFDHVRGLGLYHDQPAPTIHNYMITADT
jgi:hypothetical protein